MTSRSFRTAVRLAITQTNGTRGFGKATSVQPPFRASIPVYSGRPEGRLLGYFNPLAFTKTAHYAYGNHRVQAPATVRGLYQHGSLPQ